MFFDAQDSQRRLLISLAVVVVLHAQFLWLLNRMQSMTDGAIKVISDIELMEAAPAPVAVPFRAAVKKPKLWKNIVQALSAPKPAVSRPAPSPGNAHRSVTARPDASAERGQPALEDMLRDRESLSATRIARPDRIMDIPAETRRAANKASFQDIPAATTDPALREKSPSVDEVGVKRVSVSVAEVLENQVRPAGNAVPLKERSLSDDILESPSSARRKTTSREAVLSPAALSFRDGKEFGRGGIQDTVLTQGSGPDADVISMPRMEGGGIHRPLPVPRGNKIDLASVAAAAQKTPAVKDRFSEPRTSPMELSGPLERRRVISAVMPSYPQWARQKGIEAHVALKFFVGPEGNVLPNIFVMQTSGYGELDRECMEYVKKWVFAPLSPAEPQSEQWGIITIRFKLE